MIAMKTSIKTISYLLILIISFSGCTNNDKKTRAEGMYIVGNSLFEEGNYQGAISFYDLAIETYEKFAEAYFKRGLAKQNLTNHVNAINDFNSAISYKLRTKEVYFLRGLSKLGNEDPNGAIEDFNIAIDMDPEFEYAYINRGQAKNLLEDYDGAITDYSKAIELDSTDVIPYYFRSFPRCELQNYSGALSDLDFVIRIHPTFNRDDFFYNRGQIKIGLKDYKGALLDLREAEKRGLTEATELIKNISNLN